MARVGESDGWEWARTLGTYVTMIVFVVTIGWFTHLISGWVPGALFRAEQATVTDLSDCYEESEAGTWGVSPYCEVEWRLPDGTEGGNRIDGPPDEMAVGSMIYVDGDTGYYSRASLVHVAILPALFAVGVAFILLVFIPATFIRDRRRARKR